MDEMDQLLEDAEEVQQSAKLSKDEYFKRISAIADEVDQTEEEIKLLEKQLDEKKAHVRKLVSGDLPDLMNEIGMRTFELNDGTEVGLSDEVYAGIPETNREACLNWLRDNGFGDLIKNEVKISFGMGEDEQAQTLMNFLGHDPEKPFEFSQKTTVLAQTLKAFVREQDRKGKTIPEDLFSVHRVTVAKFKRPKAKKS